MLLSIRHPQDTTPPAPHNEDLHGQNVFSSEVEKRLHGQGLHFHTVPEVSPQ